MNSKALKLKIALAVDIHVLSDKPFSKREIVKDLVRMVVDEDYSLADIHERDYQYLMTGVTSEMSCHLTDVAIERYGIVPESLRGTLGNIPAFFCISPGGGRDAKWISSLMATVEHFEATLALRDFVMHNLQESTRSIQEAHDALKHSGATCLVELLQKKAA